MEVDNTTPRVIHAIRFARDCAQVISQPALSQGTVFATDDERKGRSALSKLVMENRALVGINGDYFPWTGDPLGAMVSNGELISRPFPGRSVFAWGDRFAEVTRLKWTASFTAPMHDPIKIDGFNETCAKDLVVLNTGKGGYALSEQKSRHIICESLDPIGPNCTIKGKVLATLTDETRTPIGKQQFVIAGTGKSIEKLQFVAKGDEITIKMKTEGLDWTKAKNVIGGGPIIVDRSKPIQAWDAEDFNSEFASKRHPRTAIGYTINGDIWLVEVEGRQSLSAGATIDELSSIMVRYDCVQALNLDGGGSSEIAMGGFVVNRPSDGAERPIANAILLFGSLPELTESEFVIKGKPKLEVGSATDYKILDSSGHVVPSSQVIWSASGDAWVDQGGRVRAIQAGKATISAWVKGNVSTVTVSIEAPKPPDIKR